MKRSLVTKQGSFWTVRIGAVEYRTTMHWRGLWIHQRMVESPLDRRFDGPIDFVHYVKAHA